MHIIAFVLALAAVVLFAAEYARTKSWLSLGLAVLTVAWMVQLIVTTGSHVTVH
jgi:uncharacterized membrane protein YGL010W